MSKNKVQFQSGYSLTDLFREYATEDQCVDTLFKWRWPDGFKCPECGCIHYCKDGNYWGLPFCRQKTLAALPCRVLLSVQSALPIGRHVASIGLYGYANSAYARAPIEIG